MTDEHRFYRIVSLACHDLRTPLATVYGFARTLERGGELDERSLRFVTMMVQASEQMTSLLDELGVAARIEGGRFEPGLVEADTVALATSEDERITTTGRGETIETDPAAVSRGLEALAIAASRFGPVDQVTWSVDGRSLALSPVIEAAAPVVLGDEVRDLGSLVARIVIEQLGGSLVLDGETLRVQL
jgi:signal transduction histidine kinase